ncbi:hypothetical protein [Phytoactinopolyspora halotolerans]|uniref:Uncharacterized protein n=1 Tax=Phytoactinopolyspora halotolerans TaxID=1981512 RepID=A0A6L9S5Z4_9ACTN|nr:hypothetical protein [Phytoactinopolyspora halotolerans]NEE00403.1 hypothetical protein [Phytoactinopolyspora halotolerans]
MPTRQSIGLVASGLVAIAVSAIGAAADVEPPDEHRDGLEYVGAEYSPPWQGEA